MDQLRRQGGNLSQFQRNMPQPSNIGAIIRTLIAFTLVISVLAASNILSLTRASGSWIEEKLLPGNSGANNQLALVRSSPATGPLRVDPANPRYFTDGSGKVILLVGSHTWDNRQDLGTGDFDWQGYLDDLQSWGHNFIRLWIWEQPYPPNGSPNLVNNDTTLTPEVWTRSSTPGANDGGNKFDLTQYNQGHFDRLRQRVIDAGNRGMYVSIMLFNGWSLFAGEADPWPYNPWNGDNNINGIDGDLNHDGNGEETYDTFWSPSMTALQDNYVEKVIDTVNDLDNVLYEICNEGGTADWHNHMIDLIHTYELGKPNQHLIMWSTKGGDLTSMLSSSAEIIAPGAGDGYNDDMPANDGAKVIINDTDHNFGIGGDADWAWKSFTRGLHPVYMDSWDNLFLDGSSIGHPIQNLRDNLGWIRDYADRMNLAAMTPRGELSSSGYALANPVTDGAEYLVYLPSGGNVTVNLSASPGQLSVEWFNPSDGTTQEGGTVTGGANRIFSAPFSGNAVFYLNDVAAVTPTPSLTPTSTNTPNPSSTPDNQAPQITDVSAHALDETVIISWDTDEPSTSQVVYGLTSALGLSTPLQTHYTNSHVVFIGDLLAGTIYYYKVFSKDPSGNQAESATFAFTTLTSEQVKRAFLPLISDWAFKGLGK